jgi:hypothetical protein
VAVLAGVRTRWRATGDGEFFCTGCGGDRSYQLLAGRRRLTVLGVPVLPRGPADPVVACGSCRGHFPVADLERPTTTRLSALLRDAVHTIALALLTVGGGERSTARRAAAASVRAAGFPDCTEERLLTLQAALWSDGRPALDREARELLAALAPHLAAPGRRSLLLHGARIALADGPYQPAERQILAGVGAALRLRPAETDRVLTEAATASGA